MAIRGVGGSSHTPKDNSNQQVQSKKWRGREFSYGNQKPLGMGINVSGKLDDAEGCNFKAQKSKQHPNMSAIATIHRQR